ncbi:transposase [Streptomyces sp. NPDC056347]|uniref:transposase n=1 Tax=Streptomyces sp. NPDC056347 TaxID=3345790 RepID=UPI0035DCC0BB
MISTVPRVITASELSWTAPFVGVAPRRFNGVVRAPRRDGADNARQGRPWGIPLEDRVLLVVGPLLALRPRKRFRKDAVLIVDGTLVPTRDHTVAEQSKNYRYSTNHQVVVDADTRLVVVVGRPLPGNRNDCKAWELSGAKAAVGKTAVIADGGCRGTGLVIPHRRDRGQSELPAWKEEHNTSHRKVRARVEHAFARMKTWKILCDCRLKGDGVHHAMLGIAHRHNLARRG